MTSGESVRLPAHELVELASQALQAAGTPPDIADTVARSSVAADLDGRPSHGVARIPRLVAKIRSGGMDPSARPTVERDHGAVLLLDAHDGFGHFALSQAAALATNRAHELGVAAVAVRNLVNPGMLAAYGREVAERDCIAILGCNSAPSMAPHGASSVFLGTNPLCVAIPTATGAPFLLDMATTVASRGAISHAAESGAPIPPGWANDSSGRPTTDPHEALVGMLLPVGGPKGAGLAIAVDVLAGLLSGAAAGPAVRGFQDPGRSGAGAFLIAVLASAFVPDGSFPAAVAEYAARIRALPPTDPHSPPRVPGDRANASRAVARDAGVPVDRLAVDSLRALASRA